MPALRFPVAVIIERVPLVNRWASERWGVAGVEPGDDPPAPPVKLDADGARERWRFAGHAIELHRSEAEGYFLNVSAPDPKVFVMWRAIEESPAPDGEPKDISPPAGERFSLRRWSRRKLAAAQAPDAGPAMPAASAAPVAPRAAESAPSVESSTAAASAALPPVESLTFESEFAPFFQPKVDESLKRAALKKLFRDPRFNIMDGLDTYIDDYARADPIPADMLRQLAQTRYIFDPPKTEISAEGNVIDSPADDRSPEAPQAAATQADATPRQGAAMPSEDSTSKDDKR